MINEEWRAIPEWPEYSVSSLGKVRREISNGPSKAGRLLTPSNKDGYSRITLCRPGVMLKIRLNRLVALVFIGNPPSDRHEAAHWDGDKWNNQVGNLRWATHQENLSDRERHGTSPRGERSAAARLRTDQVLEIKALISDGLSERKIAKLFDVSRSTVNGISAGRTWWYVQEAQGLRPE